MPATSALPQWFVPIVIVAIALAMLLSLVRLGMSLRDEPVEVESSWGGFGGGLGGWRLSSSLVHLLLTVFFAGLLGLAYQSAMTRGGKSDADSAKVKVAAAPISAGLAKTDGASRDTTKK